MSFNCCIVSSLKKIYTYEPTPTDRLKYFSMLINERKSFQLIVESSEEFLGKLDIISNIENINIFSVEYIPSQLPNSSNYDDFCKISENGLYPDLLVPITSENIKFKEGRTILWIEVSSSFVGKHNFEIKILKDNEDICSEKITVEVINAKLNFNDFIYTNWFHCDCIMTQYGIEAFSDEFWKYVENYLTLAVKHGMNCVLTPIFTPPLDTEVGGERPTVQLVGVTKNGDKYIFDFSNLTRWVEMAKKCGIKYFEMSHLFTQWGANAAPKIMATVDGEYKQIFGWKTKSTSKEYIEFLKKFSYEFKKYLETKKLKDKTFIHISDEPNFSMLRSYSRASKLIHKLFNGYIIIDALSDIWFYRLHIVSNPIPSNDYIDKFIGKVPNLWTYCCSAQKNHYVSNRFFCHSSLRTRIIGYQMFKYDIKGFLHWGYNFYFTQYSKAVIDPYKISDAGGKFPSGDCYIVYPADEGTAYPSIRLKVFYDALQDMAALNTLEDLIGKEAALKVIENQGKLSFRQYPHNDDWLLNTREKVNLAIKENIK